MAISKETKSLGMPLGERIRVLTGGQSWRHHFVSLFASHSSRLGVIMIPLGSITVFVSLAAKPLMANILAEHPRHLPAERTYE
jgi:hypothetical protein